MSAPTLFDDLSAIAILGRPNSSGDAPAARYTDPQTSHEAAERVKPGNSALVAEIRRVVKAWAINRGEPIDAFGIARAVEYANRGRWSEATIRTAISRAGLTAMDTEGRSPRGIRCLRYTFVGDI